MQRINPNFWKLGETALKDTILIGAVKEMAHPFFFFLVCTDI